MVSGLITANDIASIKGSGVVTKIVDKTQSPLIQPQGQVVLIYGFSKVGVFNRGVIIEAGDTKNLVNIFGERDMQLERKGSFFHYALETSLNEGAVIALNLLKTNDSVDSLTGEPSPNADVAQYQAFSMSPLEENPNKKNKLYSSFFKKDRFWYPSADYLLATRSILDQGNILNFANISQKKLTFVAKKSKIRGFDVTVDEWYNGAAFKPAFLRGHDLISDYFIDVYVLAGDWSNYEALSSNPVYAPYFDTQGLILSKFDDFLNSGQVTLVRLFQGSIIPNFADKDGSVKALDKIINSGTDYHGVICAIDTNQLDAFEHGTNTKHIDLVGHGFINGSMTNINFLSYKRKFSKDNMLTMSYPAKDRAISTATGFSSTSHVGYIQCTITNSHPDFSTLMLALDNGTVVRGTTTQAGQLAGHFDTPDLIISNYSTSLTSITFNLSSPIKALETQFSGSYVDLNIVGAALPVIGAVSTVIITDIPSTPVTMYIYADSKTNRTPLGAINIQAGATISSVAALMVGAINSGTSTHGYDCNIFVLNNSAMRVTYNGADGYSHNGDKIVLSTKFTAPNQSAVAYTATTFVSGLESVSAGVQYDSRFTGFYADTQNDKYIVKQKDHVYELYKAGVFKDGDSIIYDGGTAYLAFNEVNVSPVERVLQISVKTDSSLTTAGTVILGGQSYDYDGGAVPTQNILNIIQQEAEISRSLAVTSTQGENVVVMDIADMSKIKTGQYLEGTDMNGSPILVRITAIKNISVNSPIPNKMEVHASGSINTKTRQDGSMYVVRYVALDEAFTRLNAIYLKGLEIKEHHTPNGTNSRMRDIISVMTETNIRKTLVDPDMTSFRYVVDTFNHGLEPQAKNYITRLVRDRSKAMALLNMPSTKELSNSKDPMFSDAPTPSNPLQPLSAAYIANGGNAQMNPSFLMSRPEESDGASYALFFYPNLVKMESDSSISSIPPAIHVVNNYIRKWKNGDGFKATAGLSRGTIADSTIIGLEHELDKDDRGELETKGINPLRQYDDGTIAIYGNQTSYHKFRSILNQANSRDTLITIEMDTEKMLDGYVFENAFSDDVTRTTILTMLQNYFNNLRDSTKAIEYGIVKFDRQNNPDWVVAESASIIDVEVKLPNVSRKFISRITLVGGSTSVGSFTAV